MESQTTFHLQQGIPANEMHRMINALTWWQEFIKEFYPEGDCGDAIAEVKIWVDEEAYDDELGKPEWSHHGDGLTEHMYAIPDHPYAYKGFVSSEALWQEREHNASGKGMGGTT